MSTLERWGPSGLPEGTVGRTRALLAVLGIAVGAFLAGMVGILGVGALASAAGVAGTDAYEVLSGNLIQVGFAAFGAGYLLWRGDRERFVRLRRPTLEDLAWVAGLPVAFGLLGLVLEPALAAVGLPHPTPGGGHEGIALASRPDLWPVAFVGLYLFAAPAEELVFRGIVQGRLRGTFDTAGVVLGGGLAFGLLHFLAGLPTAGVGVAGALYWGIETFFVGILWGIAYERTGNLAVTAVNHAMMWTVPFHAVFVFLGIG